MIKTVPLRSSKHHRSRYISKSTDGSFKYGRKWLHAIQYVKPHKTSKQINRSSENKGTQSASWSCLGARCGRNGAHQAAEKIRIIAEDLHIWVSTSVVIQPYPNLCAFEHLVSVPVWHLVMNGVHEKGCILVNWYVVPWYLIKSGGGAEITYPWGFEEGIPWQKWNPPRAMIEMTKK